jgi:hypothetical protein
MTKTFRLEALKDALDIAATLTKSWFRGHSRALGSLVPRLFRPEYRDPMFQWFRSDLELSTIESFKRHAPIISDRQVPAENDRFGWLCLMQHYRMPTRLLDWTENALVALYFAVSAHHEENGELWAMLPWALNAQAGADWAIPIISESPHVKYLLRQPYWGGSTEKLCEEVRLKSAVVSPVAVAPPFIFPRMAVQASTFTIHPIPNNDREIPDVLPDPSHLVRYVIPKSSKWTLVQQLRTLGFSERHLFPDLEGLSRMIVADEKVVAYGPPNPPRCSGEWEGGD